MKKIILSVVLLGFTFTITAQDIANQTIGVRLGNYLGASYQKKISDDSRVELGLGYKGYAYYNDVKIDAYYHKVFDFEPLDNMNWYVGAGGGVGVWNYDSRYYYSYYDYNDHGTYFFVGGTAGAEYKFDFPLLVSIDVRPEFVFGNFYNGIHVNVGLGARYTF